MRLLLLLLIASISLSSSAQNFWEKTKAEAIPKDLKNTVLLVEKFKTEKEDSAPDEAYLKDKKKGHPLIKETNDELSEYNKQLRTIFKGYNHKYILTSKKKSEDEDGEYFGTDTCKYSLKHVVYLRKYMEGGALTHFYTYVFYFHDRTTGKDYPYIYLFEKKRLKSLEEIVAVLNDM